MPTTQTLVIGAGQAGLAVSRCLTEAGVDHVVLERGSTGERWRSERWDSLRLLSPNWATRLPGWSYVGPDPDGFMSAGDLARHLAAYAASFDAPVIPDRPVVSVRRAGGGFTVRTPEQAWEARDVVLATGWCDQPRVPAVAAALDPAIAQLTPTAYRRPDDLPDGGVLVVGASATGVQLADELARSGRDVTLAVGRHSRVPRRYRGMDIWWWFDQIGTFSKTIDEVADPVAARQEGALQLVGRDDHRDVDLRALHALGVGVTGRLVAVDGRRVRFGDDLTATTAAADERLGRLLDQIDEHIARAGLGAEVLPATRPVPVPNATTLAPLDEVDLRHRGIATVLWATGYQRPLGWLHLPVFDRLGEVTQRRGVTPVAGFYVVGQRFQHRRDANFIDGVRHDATFLARHIVQRHRCPQPAAC